ncbi:hypothetical protein D3C85_1532410 [compost metagenome]
MKYLNEESPYHHHCSYIEGKLAGILTEVLDDKTEDREQMREYAELYEERLVGVK